MSTGSRAGVLLSRFTVTPVSDGVFTGTCHPAWPGKAFGGQIAAQLLQSAAATADAALHPWSIHTIFHSPIASGEPIDYRVVDLKSGRTVASRQVLAEQGGSLRASAVVVLGSPASGPVHQITRPEAVGPEDAQRVERLLTAAILPPDVDYVALGYPVEAMFELRVAQTPEHVAQADSFGTRTWMRTLESLPDDPLTVATALCYLSDVTLGTAAIEPHGGRESNPDLQFGAVELALWFTGRARLDEWTLFSQDSSFAGSGHALAHGGFFNSDGELCAVALQHALMRQRS